MTIHFWQSDTSTGVCSRYYMSYFSTSHREMRLHLNNKPDFQSIFWPHHVPMLVSKESALDYLMFLKNKLIVITLFAGYCLYHLLQCFKWIKHYEYHHRVSNPQGLVPEFSVWTTVLSKAVAHNTLIWKYFFRFRYRLTHICVMT